MGYYMTKTVSGAFAVVVADVVARLQKQGFGVLTDIDMQATLQDKLGLLLPCNVIVRETADHRVEVASIDPVSTMERTGNPALQSTAREVQRLLSEAIEQVGS